MTLLEELEEFASPHRPHDSLVPDAETPMPNGYMLTVAGPCGVAFMRWVTPDDAAFDLTLLHRLKTEWQALSGKAGLGFSQPRWRC